MKLNHIDRQPLAELLIVGSNSHLQTPCPHMHALCRRGHLLIFGLFLEIGSGGKDRSNTHCSPFESTYLKSNFITRKPYHASLTRIPSSEDSEVKLTLTSFQTINHYDHKFSHFGLIGRSDPCPMPSRIVLTKGLVVYSHTFSCLVELPLRGLTFHPLKQETESKQRLKTASRISVTRLIMRLGNSAQQLASLDPG
jgi:hypothetical protein